MTFCAIWLFSPCLHEQEARMLWEGVLCVCVESWLVRGDSGHLLIVSLHWGTTGILTLLFVPFFSSMSLSTLSPSQQHGSLDKNFPIATSLVSFFLYLRLLLGKPLSVHWASPGNPFRVLHRYCFLHSRRGRVSSSAVLFIRNPPVHSSSCANHGTTITERRVTIISMSEILWQDIKGTWKILDICGL